MVYMITYAAAEKRVPTLMYGCLLARILSWRCVRCARKRMCVWQGAGVGANLTRLGIHSRLVGRICVGFV